MAKRKTALAPTWERVKEEWDKAEQMGHQAVLQAATVGQMLIELKDSTPHGEWTSNVRRVLRSPSDGAAKVMASDLQNLARHRHLIESKKPDSQRAALEIIKAQQPPRLKRPPAIRHAEAVPAPMVVNPLPEVLIAPEKKFAGTKTPDPARREEEVLKAHHYDVGADDEGIIWVCAYSLLRDPTLKPVRVAIKEADKRHITLNGKTYYVRKSSAFKVILSVYGESEGEKFVADMRQSIKMAEEGEERERKKHRALDRAQGRVEAEEAAEEIRLAEAASRGE